MDCWNENFQSQTSGGRRMGYMGHLVDIMGAVQSTLTTSDEFRALIESSLTPQDGGDGESLSVDQWRRALQSNEDELKTQKRFLADCDPTENQDFGGSGLAGFPPSTAEYENDTEDFDYQFHSSML